MLCLVRTVLIVALMSASVLSDAVPNCEAITTGDYGVQSGGNHQLVNIQAGFKAEKVATLTTAPKKVDLCKLSKSGAPDLLYQLTVNALQNADGVLILVPQDTPSLAVANSLIFKDLDPMTPICTG